MIKLDITTSQPVMWGDEQAIIRSISKDGQVITLEVGAEGRVVEAEAEELLIDNPDLVYEEEDRDDRGLLRWIEETDWDD